MLPFTTAGMYRRALNIYGCALMTSGSFTMMASGGLF